MLASSCFSTKVSLLQKGWNFFHPFGVKVHMFLQCWPRYVTTNTDHMRTTDTVIRLFLVILIVAYYRDGVIITLEKNIMILVNH